MEGTKLEGIQNKILKSFKIGSNQDLIIKVTIAIIVVLLGVLSGWFLSVRNGGQKSVSFVNNQGTEGGKNKEVGLKDENTFRDAAEGVLLEGGINGEGTHHLDRGLGPDKYVYLNSTVIDLQRFVNKKVKVWGETVSAKKAGWLMDVGRVKITE